MIANVAASELCFSVVSTRCGVEKMRRTIVLSGDCQDAETAAKWAEDEARKARFTDGKSEALGARVLKSYRAACKAFFAEDGAAQMVMLCLDLNRAVPKFELISDGEQARGTVSASRDLQSGERSRHGLLDGLTCVSVPA